MPTQQIKGASLRPMGKVDLNPLITHFATPDRAVRTDENTAFALMEVNSSERAARRVKSYRDKDRHMLTWEHRPLLSLKTSFYPNSIYYIRMNLLRCIISFSGGFIA